MHGNDVVGYDFGGKESKSERHKLWARRSLGGERSGGWSEMQMAGIVKGNCRKVMGGSDGRIWERAGVRRNGGSGE